MRNPASSACVIMASIVAMGAFGANPTIPGAPSSPYPTIHNLAIDWPITGDDNLNGVVNVRYRVQGEPEYLQGMPLRRIPADSNEGFSWANRHSGSVFDLQPATAYEIELALSDSDGGSTTETIIATTRAVPVAADDSTTVSVNPGNFAAMASAAQPGQILLLQDGLYGGFTFGKNGTATDPIVI